MEHSEESLRTEEIEKSGQSNIQGKYGNIYCMSIIGQIEGHMALPPQNKATKYEHIIPTLVSIEEDEKIEGLLIVLNTMGGDVEAGLAISELIAGMSKPTVSLVLGGGHSIGVPLAVAADYSFIAPSATMIIHPIRLSGTVISAEQTFDYLSKMQERVVKFILAHCRANDYSLDRLMKNTSQLVNDVGTMMIGEEAVREGIIDQVGSISSALSKLQAMIEEKNSGGDQ